MDYSNDLLTKINQSLINMSKGQKQIAQYILKNYDKAAFITASKMGQLVGVSESTVVRFAYAMGYDGYPELQKSLQELIRNKLTSVQRIQLSSDIKQNDVLKSVLKADMHNIRATIETIDEKTFNTVVDWLFTAKSVYILGLRSSTPLAQFLAYYLNFVLDDVRLVTASANDVYEQIISIGGNDLLIGISFPRYSTRTVEAMRYAKSQGANVVALTDSPISPVAEIADECLSARSDMASFADSLVAPLSLINALIVAAGMRNTDEITKRFDRLEAIWQMQKVYVKNETE